MFGYVSQFVFRYLVIIRDKNVSSTKYFFLLFLMLLFPFAHCVNLFISYFPPVEHATMDDKSVAEILGINLDDDQIILAGYSFNNIRQTISLAYIILVCTISYLIIFTLAYHIEKFLKNKMKLRIASYGPNQQMIEMNKQISRTLIVQASMPLMIYLSVLFLLAIILFKIDSTHSSWLQYYNLFSSIPQFVPSALNPIVSIWLLRYYRNAFVSDIKCLAVYIRRKLLCHRAITDEQQQQNQQNIKWAISVVQLPKQPSKQ
ncbi:hypothetical protein niasHS_016720 [Heterodera schachtii]|uniref:G-protein coupled receptors family 1 profile domain-containing protein n=1 Tax=Heterodera schachtii TaxID=97005 RepID=A0ABD2HWT0_HETSC